MDKIYSKRYEKEYNFRLVNGTIDPDQNITIELENKESFIDVSTTASRNLIIYKGILEYPYSVKKYVKGNLDNFQVELDL